MNLAVGGIYWLVSGVMSVGYGMMKVQRETETISFIIRTSLFH